MATLQEHNEQIAEKLALSPHLDAALNAAISEEGQQLDPAAAAEQAQALEQSNANVEGWKIAVMQVVPMVEALIPEFRQKVQKAQWEAFGEALGEACDHYGFGVGEAFSHPLVKLAVAAFPIGFAGWQIKEARTAALQAENKRVGVSVPTVAQKPRGEPEMQQTGAVNVQAAGVTVTQMTAEKTP